jgi:site-specific recombinase XerD
VPPVWSPGLRALRQLQHAAPGMAYVFLSERGGPLTARAVHHLVAQAGVAAALTFPVHPHRLRHACGFYLANKGVDIRTLQQSLGPRNIQPTVRYTAFAPHRFQDFWED